MLRRLAPAIVGCVAVSSCYVATHYEGWRYQGGRIVNNGLFTRPRFEAPFPSIRLSVPGTYEFSSAVHLRIVDQDNRTQCEATGWPAGKGWQQLVVTSSAGVIGLWHTGCARLDLRTCAPCRLYIAIGPVDPQTPGIMLIPTLQGGGWELL